MAHLDPKDSFDHFKERVVDAVQTQFPIKGSAQSLHLHRVEVDDKLDPGDIRAQHQAKVSGGSWTVPVYAHVQLKDNASDKVISSARIKIADLPKTTMRFSHILDGQEYQVDNQWQLRPGVYARRRQNGELESRFNVSGKAAFDVVFDPNDKQFILEYGKSKLPLYPFMKAAGVSDTQLESTWGKEILAANKGARGASGALQRFYKSTAYKEAPSQDAAEQHVRDMFAASKLRPEATKLTLGKEFGEVSGDTLHLATGKLLKVQAGHPEDDRDSLLFKDLRSIGDFVHDKITGASKTIRQKALRNLNTARDVREVLKADMFAQPVQAAFHKNSCARVASQINPVEMVSSAQQTTIMGSGGIQSDRSVTQDAKMIDDSHIGFLDPINTPEGCHDSCSEVFTSSGWLPWPQVTRETELACLIDGRMEFHRPLALVAAPYTGPMHRLRTDGAKGVRANKPIDYLVTPNHRIWARPVDEGLQYRFARADEMHGKSRVFQVGHAALRGSEQRTFKLPYVAGNNSSLNVSEVNLADWAALLGWVLSEGHAACDTETSHYSVRIHQSDLPGPNECARIEALLNRLPFNWSVTKRENGRNVYTLATKQVASYFVQFGLSYEKFIPEEAFGWPVAAREALLDALMRGDGRQGQRRANGKEWAGETYTTTSHALALGVERLMISLGFAARVRSYQDKREERYLDVYEVRQYLRPERHVQRPQAKRAYSIEQYAGMVYCAEVPGGLMYIRRGDSVGHWSGNSRTGVTLRLPIGVKKVGHEAKVEVYNLKTGKGELLSPLQMNNAKVAFSDQFHWKEGKPTALNKTIKAAVEGNQIREIPAHEADYTFYHPSQVFNLTSNLVPFMNSTSAGRIGMATRHIEQAISLRDREQPLVQVGTGVHKPGLHTFEHVMGAYAAHQAPVDGKVVSVKPDAIHILDSAGKKHEVQLYNNYPLNDAKSSLTSTPLVGVGDVVRAHQPVADTNYSKNGALALGTNLRVGYMAWKGINYEDGIVISQSAADKLTSEHMSKPELKLQDTHVLDKKRFLTQLPFAFKQKQLDKLDDKGVIKVGQSVAPGDPLIATMKPFELKDRQGLGSFQKSKVGTHNDSSLRWDSGFEGTVTAVHHGPDGIQVHVKTLEPMQVADKMSSRNANKGVVAAILPDHEMPRDKDGKPLQVLLNFTGVGGRINLSQMYEVAASKIAKKTGKPYVIENFSPGVDNLKKLQSELKSHGLSDTEEIFDPASGHSLGHILTGHQHMFKLVHQVEKKESVRSGMTLKGQSGGETYDINLQPTSGGGTGGQSVGALGIYALLAHGAHANLREMQTLKAEGIDPQTDESKQWKTKHRETWAAIQQGTPIPNPKTTFAYEKFQSMLKGAGINIEKKGHEVCVSPLTDKQILHLSQGREVTKPAEMVYGKSVKGTDELKPRPGGLFDERLTGGHGGNLWSHIKLAEPTPNPLFESPIRALTGLSGADYQDVLYGKKGIGPSGALVPPNVGLTSGAAIKALLDKVDVKTALPKARKELDQAKTKDVDKLLKKVKYLTALSELQMSPSDAYILHHLPIIPPVMRPASALPSGDVKFADINGLYTKLGQTNATLQDKTLQANWTEARKAASRQAYHESVAAIMGVGVPYADAKLKGILHQISGGQPKCFDGETEVLTNNGWVRLDRYNGTDVLGTVNLDEDMFEWQAPTAFHVTPYDGPMHRLAGAHINLLVTPNHNHVVSRMFWDKGQRMWAPWDLRPSAEFLGPRNRSRLMTAAKHWNGEMKQYAFDGHVVEPVAFAAFVGWWVAEGWTSKNKYVYIPQSKPDGIELIDAVFLALGLPYYRAEYVKPKMKSGHVTYWRIKSEALAAWLTLHVGDGCDNKRLSTEILGWHPAMLTALLEGYLGGDGDSAGRNRRKVVGKKTHWRMSAVGTRFVTTSPQLVGDLQQLAVKLGLLVTAAKRTNGVKAHHLDRYRATVRGFRDVSFGEHLRMQVEEGFSGLVYGPTVPNGTVVVRRQGAVCVSGNSGFVQNVLMSPRQDLSMRTVIIPGPHLGLDEVGLPKEYAKKLFEPFMVKKLTEMGAARTSLEAQALLVEGTSKHIDTALERVMSERPVLLKRDPALHSYSVQAFHPKIAASKAIEMHPLACGGFGADFDGDTMSVYVPLHKDAVDEAHKMMPSQNLFAKATGKLMYTPTLEYAFGMYKLSDVGKHVDQKFSHPADVLKAFQSGKLLHNDVVSLGEKKTTAGRLLLATGVPEGMQNDVMHNLDLRLDKKGAESLLSSIAKKHPDKFDHYVNRLKDLGAGCSTGYIEAPIASPTQAIGTAPIMKFHMPAHTLTLKDLEVDHAVRDPILKKARKEVEAVTLTSGLTQGEKDRRAIDIYTKADEEMYKAHTAHAKLNPNHLMQLNMAGIKPGKAQYQQIVLAPMLMKNSKNETIPTPITNAYSEGLDLGQYWTGMHGARRGAVMKVQEVQEPGYLSKLLVNTTMNQVVTAHDCKTDTGITLSASDPSVHDRHLARPFTAGHTTFAAGTLLDPHVVGQIKAIDKDAQLVVRSPLKCAHDKGVCQLCMGKYQSGDHPTLGANVGIIASQSIGERAVQLTLKEFHCMHEHSTVLVRQGKRVFHTTLGRLFDRGKPLEVHDGEEVRTAHKLEVWDLNGWTKVKSVRRHLQQPGTAMVFTRSRAGFGILSQDNHPHMAQVNNAVCGTCGTYPKRHASGKFSCRKCGFSWPKSPEATGDLLMVEPQEMGNKTHSAVLAREPATTLSLPAVQSGWLAGMYCAEGCVLVRKEGPEKRPYTTGVGFGQMPGAIATRLGKAIEKEHGKMPGYTGKEFQLYATMVGQAYAGTFGRYSRNKGLPDGWCGLPGTWLSDFVAGVFDGDGTFVSNNNTAWQVCRIDTTSFLLAQQVHAILRGAGVPARIILTPRRKLTRHQGFAVTFGFTERVAALLSSSSKVKGTAPKPASNDERFPETIDYIRPVYFATSPYVYDLETESHTLYVGGMLTHNTGGTAGGSSKATNAFVRFQQLTQLPQTIRNAATLAMHSGTVEKVEQDATGTKVHIAGKVHHVGRDSAGNPLAAMPHGALDSPGYTPWQPPKVGMTIEAGQILSDPNRTNVNPHDLYKATGSMSRVQGELVKEMHDIYKGEGVDRRHIELLVRAMGGVSKVSDSGDHPTYLRGEFHPTTQLDAVNRELKAKGQRTIQSSPVLKGVAELPLIMQDDWMAKLQHKHIRGTLMEAAATAGRSDIHGIHPVPSLMFGAEHGRSAKDSLSPDFAHLKNVPKSHY